MRFRFEKLEAKISRTVKRLLENHVFEQQGSTVQTTLTDYLKDPALANDDANRNLIKEFKIKQTGIKMTQ